MSSRTTSYSATVARRHIIRRPDDDDDDPANNHTVLLLLLLLLLVAGLLSTAGPVCEVIYLLVDRRCFTWAAYMMYGSIVSSVTDGSNLHF